MADKAQRISQEKKREIKKEKISFIYSWLGHKM